MIIQTLNTLVILDNLNAVDITHGLKLIGGSMMGGIGIISAGSTIFGVVTGVAITFLILTICKMRNRSHCNEVGGTQRG